MKNTRCSKCFAPMHLIKNTYQCERHRCGNQIPVK